MSGKSSKRIAAAIDYDKSFALLAAIDAAVIVCKERQPCYANRAALQLCGDIPGTLETLWQQVAAEDQAALATLFDSAPYAGDAEPARQVLRFAGKEAAERRLRISIVRLTDEENALALCTLQDVTAAGLQPALPATDETVLRRLVNGFPGLAYRARSGPDWPMELVSDGCLDLTGHASRELLPGGGVSYRQLIHPDDRMRVLNELQAALEERRCFQLVYRLMAADQSEKWIWEHGVGIYDAGGQMQVIEGFIVDITERKRTENKIREGQRSLATLVSNLQGMAYRCSHTREWDMYFVSDGCFDLTGYASSELLYSRTIAYGDLVHPDDRDQAVAEVERAVAEHRPFRVVYRILTATGQEKLVWDQGSAVFAADGTVRELEGFITELASPAETLL